ncbi:hypothetical protein E6O75_ATG11389 [Venturia nashicola]|uniref:Uncharacterized protein n=1 Tax=Venturia nashicola TaxID=86259 RepID=A0A4Z1P1J9_9PEZI|nr:hypothetical protein E6O75_ATG11389 [Venturia nashicola]
MSTKHASTQLFNALIRTHHITSKKKVARLKKAAATHNCYVLLRSGGCPGIMYCEGDEPGVKGWVAVVQSLRYKDYSLAARPAPVEANPHLVEYGKLFEVAQVKDFSVVMAERGIVPWWRKAMGWPEPM